MIPCADDDMGAIVSDWFDCADAFLLGRIGGHLADARSSTSADAEFYPRGGHGTRRATAFGPADPGRGRYASAFLLARNSRSS
jgi:hypothetical protein